MTLRCQGLTERQLEVLILAHEGHTIAETASLLGVAQSTVRVHSHSACATLGVSHRKDALEALGAAALGVDDDEPPLIVDKPFLAAYLDEFDRWIRSGKADGRARDGMLIALWGAMNGE